VTAVRSAIARSAAAVALSQRFTSAPRLVLADISPMRASKASCHHECEGVEVPLRF
jgi:hypothetical protein